MTRNSLGENRSLKCPVKLDERTLEFTNNTLTIALRSV